MSLQYVSDKSLGVLSEKFTNFPNSNDHLQTAAFFESLMPYECVDHNNHAKDQAMGYIHDEEISVSMYQQGMIKHLVGPHLHTIWVYKS